MYFDEPPRNPIKRIAARLVDIVFETRFWFSFLGKRESVKTLDYLPGESILFFAPHPDDELIDGGGALIKHLERGDNASVVYFTDGAKSTHPTMNRVEIREQRKKEAVAVANFIGLQDYCFLEYPDGKLKFTKEDAARVAYIIERLRPDLVFLPIFLHDHPDHTVINDFFIYLYENSEILRKSRVVVSGGLFPLTPVFGNVLIDITNIFSKKLRALRLYHSQLLFLKNYLTLSRYLSFLSDKKIKYSELYLITTAEKYVGFYKAFGDKFSKEIYSSLEGNIYRFTRNYFKKFRQQAREFSNLRLD